MGAPVGAHRRAQEGAPSGGQPLHLVDEEGGDEVASEAHVQDDPLVAGFEDLPGLGTKAGQRHPGCLDAGLRAGHPQRFRRTSAERQEQEEEARAPGPAPQGAGRTGGFTAAFHSWPSPDRRAALSGWNH